VTAALVLVRFGVPFASLVAPLAAGGVALEMLRGIDELSNSSADIALVPLASPLVAGPGAIATIIVLTRQNPRSWADSPW
jgi:small neutral amino acid transporter SnatA (MarC family)